MLLGNYTVLSKGPGKFIGGSTVADSRGNFNKSGANRNFWAGWATVATPNIANLQSRPSGYSEPGAWVMAPKAGGISARNVLSGAGALALSIAGGVNGDAALTGLGEITNAPLQLIVSAVAALVGSGDISAAGLAGKLEAVAALSGSGDLAGAIGALAGVFADINGTGALTAAMTALGHMDAELTPFTELSPQTLAAAVWAAVIDSGYSAEEVLRLLAAVAVGKSDVVDLGGGAATVTFRDLADSKDRVIADMVSSERTSVTKDAT